MIGLAVLAGAAIFGVVLPMLNAGTKTTDVTVAWSGSGVASQDATAKTITFTVTVTNGGLADITGTVAATGVVVDPSGTPKTSTSVSLKVGSTDVTTNGFYVAAGKQISVIITATFAALPSTGLDVKVSFDYGSVGSASATFTAKSG